MARYAINVPLNGRSLAEQRDWIERARDLGYTDLWSSESVVTDGFTPIADVRAGPDEGQLVAHVTIAA